MTQKISAEDFKKKYSQKTYLGDGLYVLFDGYHFILSAERSDGIHWVALEPPVFDNFVKYRERVYEEAKNIEE